MGSTESNQTLHSNESIRCDNSELSSEQISEIATPRRFRWRVVPAALSWCFGGVALFALPFGIYHTIGTNPLEADLDYSTRMVLWAQVVGLPAGLIFGVLNLLSGFRWMSGRWALALFFNAMGYGAMMVPEIMYILATNTAIQM